MRDMAKTGMAKSNKNQQQGYSFRGIDDVYNALASLLSQHNLVVLPRVLSREQTERQSAKGGVIFSVALHVEFDFVSSEDGSKHTVVTFGEAMDSADKATNKAMSAAYKYACIQAFCIPTEGDNDADATTHEVLPITQPTITAEQVAEVREYLEKTKLIEEEFLAQGGYQRAEQIYAKDYPKVMKILKNLAGEK
jgi:hypothetical protein